MVVGDASNVPLPPALQDVKISSTRAPAAVCHPSRTRGEPFGSHDEVISAPQQTASSRKLFLSPGSLSSIGKFGIPDTKRHYELQGN